MKRIVKFISLILSLTIADILYGQDFTEAAKSPQKGEEEIGRVTSKISRGDMVYVLNFGYNNAPETDKSNLSPLDSDDKYYKILYREAKEKYGQKYPNFKLRNFRISPNSRERKSGREGNNSRYYTWRIVDFWVDLSATVVYSPQEAKYENISKAINKALLKVKEGSRIAIDAVYASNGTEREDYKDYLVNLLLDKGYRVVAKEYLEKLYNEQQQQQSGIYNDRTLVQENNFSAIGFFIGLKVTESKIKVQVVNVSTGEYEGYIIENLNATNSKTDANIGYLSKAIDRALSNVREGSRFAVDGVSVQNGDRDDYKDQVINLLLDKSYKVVAKEYLEKLYEEQQKQQSGIYNDRTLVQENNFSAVGYYINVKVTETSLRVQVVNVSTGEYEGSSTITF